tara:strand:+ start:16624 stop:19374 length:2751 start_codon:yes stop_codon:yes gene_type:complete
MAIKTRETNGTGVTNKDAPLTNAEVDNNFIELVAEDATKLDLSGGTLTGNVTTSGLLSFGNSTAVTNNRIRLGAGPDLQIYHNGVDSFIENGSGGGILTINNGSGSGDVKVTAHDSQSASTTYFQADASEGEAQLYHLGSKKLVTESTGIRITGTLSLNGAYTFPTSDGSANQVLQTDGNGSLSFADVSGGVTVQDEGTNLSTTGTTLNFVGAGVHATGQSATKTITIDQGLSNVVEDTSPELGGTLEADGFNIEFTDSSAATDGRAKFGTGDDLQIYHDGGRSYISNTGGVLQIEQSSGDDIIFKNLKASPSTSLTDYLKLDRSTGQVNLYHYGSEKLETKSTGIQVNGTITLTDGLGNTTYAFPTADGSANQVLQTDGSGTLSFATVSGGGSGITVQDEGSALSTDATTLNFVGAGVTATGAGATKTITIDQGLPTTGGTITGNVDLNANLSFDDSTGSGNNRIRMGTGNDLHIFHNGTNAKINNNTGALQIANNTDDSDVTISTDDGSGGTATYFRADGSTGDAILYHYGTEKLKTQSGGVDVTGNITVSGTVDGRDVAADGATADAALPKAGGTMTGNILFGDEVDAQFGDDFDFVIKHTGSKSQINNNNGIFQINQLQADQDVVIRSDNGSAGTADYFRADGSTGDAILYHYGSEKIKTQSGGVDVTGDITISGTDIFHQLEGDATNGAGFKNREIVSRGVFTTGTGACASRYVSSQTNNVIPAGNPNGYFFTNVSFIANYLVALPISIPGVDESTTTSINTFVFRIGSSGANANTTIGMGLYTLNKFGLPSQLVSQGTASVASSISALSYVEITPSVTAITPGRYALCISNLGASISHLAHNFTSGSGASPITDGFFRVNPGSAMSSGLRWTSQTSSTMPTNLATVGTAWTAITSCPLINVSLGTAYSGE